MDPTQVWHLVKLRRQNRQLQRELRDLRCVAAAYRSETCDPQQTELERLEGEIAVVRSQVEALRAQYPPLVMQCGTVEELSALHERLAQEISSRQALQADLDAVRAERARLDAVLQDVLSQSDRFSHSLDQWLKAGANMCEGC